MTSLFIANCTKQDHDFNFRLPENQKLLSVPIPKGKQEKILGDLSDTDIKAIVEQHHRYGLVHIDEARKVKDFAGLCYSDKPITAKAMQNLYDHNQDVLEERGEEQRKQAAVVAQVSLDGQLQAVGQTTNAVEVDQVELRAPDDQREDKPLQQTIRVDKRDNDGRGRRGGRNR